MRHATPVVTAREEQPRDSPLVLFPARPLKRSSYFPAHTNIRANNEFLHNLEVTQRTEYVTRRISLNIDTVYGCI